MKRRKEKQMKFDNFVVTTSVRAETHTQTDKKKKTSNDL